MKKLERKVVQIPKYLWDIMKAKADDIQEPVSYILRGILKASLIDGGNNKNDVKPTVNTTDDNDDF